MEFRYVNGHVEVFLNGIFLFSADTKAEALREIEEMEEAVRGADLVIGGVSSFGVEPLS